MANPSIKHVLMDRDNMSEEDADNLINQAASDLDYRISIGQMPFAICQEWFGLEPDYIDDLLERLI